MNITKYILISAVSFILTFNTHSQAITIPGSQFPVVSHMSNYFRIIGVDTNGGRSVFSNTRSNFTVSWSTMVGDMSTAIASTIGNQANVLTLGALGGTNDDTAILQTLLNSGGQFLFPATNYTTGPLYVTNSTIITGAGGAVIKLKSGSTNAGVFNWVSGVTNVIIQNLTLDGGYYVDPTVSWTGRSSSSNRMGMNLWINSLGSFIQGVSIRGFDKGLNIFGDQDGIAVFNNGQAFFSQMDISSCFYGVYASSTTTPNMAVEYFRPIQMNLHSNTCGFYVAGGNIDVEGFDINGNYWGVIVEGSVQNSAHGMIANNFINHNQNGILVANLTGGQGQLIGPANQIRATATGNSISISNSATVTVFGNQFGGSEQVSIGASGVAGSSKGPNFITFNSHSGVWGGSPGLKVFDWNNFSDLVFDNTTNAQHWGNFSYSNSTNSDPYPVNPYLAGQIEMSPTNMPPAVPFTFNASFTWHSNGVHDYILRSSNLLWISTNFLN